MINLEIIPDNQRIAVLCESGSFRLVGPGLTFVRTPPGTRRCLISVGDHGQLVTLNQAQFGNTLLPVELRGPAPANAVRVLGFCDHAIVVAAEDTTVPPAQDRPVSEQEAVPVRYTARAFWVGLPVMLFFAIVCWMGFLHAVQQIRTERAVYQHGVLTTGTVVAKTLYQWTRTGEPRHYVTYAFRTPAGVTERKEIDVKFQTWDRLRENGSISIRYVPEKPELNLPDGWHKATLYYLVGGLALPAALFFSVAAMGILIKRLTGGYRGEIHPFLGERRPQRQRP